MSARSRNPTRAGSNFSCLPSRAVFLTIGILSSSSRASSAVSTGVLPFFTTYLGPRTAWAGFDIEDVADHQPVEQHAERGQVLLDRRRRELALQFLDECSDVDGLNAGELADAAGL